MKYLMQFVCFAALCSCATPYVPPPANLKPPPLWSGEARRFALPDSPGFQSGICRQGEAFLEERTDVTRTGIILDEIKYKDPFGKEVVIPSNTPVHVKQLSVMQTWTGGYGGSRQTNLNAQNDPIEWCFSIPAETACIFWEGENAARYISMYAISRRNLLGFSASGMRGPMPNIVESPGAYGGPIIFRMRLTQINNVGIEITRTIQDGDEVEHDMGARQSLPWAGKDFVDHDNFRMKAIHNNEGVVDAVEVTSIK